MSNFFRTRQANVYGELIDPVDSSSFNRKFWLPFFVLVAISSTYPQRRRGLDWGSGRWSGGRVLGFSIRFFEMGAVPSTPRSGKPPGDTAEYLMSAFVGEKPYPLSSEFWNQLLELPLAMQWPQDRVLQACQLFGEYSRSLSFPDIKNRSFAWLAEVFFSPKYCESFIRQCIFEIIWMVKINTSDIW